MEEMGHLVEILITGPTIETHPNPSEVKGPKRKLKWVKFQSLMKSSPINPLEILIKRQKRAAPKLQLLGVTK